MWSGSFHRPIPRSLLSRELSEHRAWPAGNLHFAGVARHAAPHRGENGGPQAAQSVLISSDLPVKFGKCL